MTLKETKAAPAKDPLVPSARLIDARLIDANLIDARLIADKGSYPNKCTEDDIKVR